MELLLKRSVLVLERLHLLFKLLHRASDIRLRWSHAQLVVLERRSLLHVGFGDDRAARIAAARLVPRINHLV